MKINILSALPALATLMALAPQISAEVKSLEGDQILAQALKTSPLLAARLQKISAEWRAVESDEIAAARDKNFFSRIKAIALLLKDAGVLGRDAAGVRTDPALVAEISANPVLQAHLATIAGEWDQLTRALSGL